MRVSRFAQTCCRGFVAVTTVVAAQGCDRSAADASAARATEATRSPRPIRVLVQSGLKGLRIRADQGGDILDAATQQALLTLSPRTWAPLACGESGGWTIAGREFSADDLLIRSSSADPIWALTATDPDDSVPLRLPGLVRLDGGDGGAALINELDLEDYVACVAAREVRADFHAEAFAAQTILCRTFALCQMRDRETQRYDVIASEGSQVYAGLDDGPAGRKAREAALRTRGLVCVAARDGCEDIFPTYYSAACGGASQSAWEFVPSQKVEPLRGLVTCDYCRIAPEGVYRWGPVEVDEAAVREALVRRYPELPALGRLKSVEVRSRTELGRPLSLVLTDEAGRCANVLAEHLRLAVGSRLMRSTDCQIRLDGRLLRFDAGQGFGHGLGLCQWGMQGQALSGHKAADILRYYFPGSSLVRAY